MWLMKINFSQHKYLFVFFMCNYFMSFCATVNGALVFLLL